jgi:hypothetical protein
MSLSPLAGRPVGHWAKGLSAAGRFSLLLLLPLLALAFLNPWSSVVHR